MTKFLNYPHYYKLYYALENGCSSVGRAVASDTQDPRFKSSHQEILFSMYSFKSVLKRQKYRKRGKEWPILTFLCCS